MIANLIFTKNFTLTAILFASLVRKKNLTKTARNGMKEMSSVSSSVAGAPSLIAVSVKQSAAAGNKLREDQEMTKEMKEYLLEQREVNRKAWQAMKDLGNIRMMDIYDGKEKMINELLEKFDEQS